MQADPEKIRTIVGDPAFPVVGDHALRQIDNAYTVVFDERTGTNRAARDKEATIKELAATLPPATETDVSPEDDAALMVRLNGIDAAKTARLAEIDGKLSGYRSEHETKVAGLRGQIEALQTQVGEEIADFANTQTRAGAARETSTNEFAEQRAPVAAALASIHSNRDAAIRAKQTRETVDRMETEAEALREDGRRQTAALDSLLAYKSELLRDGLPIDGLEVRDGEIFRHDVPFDRLNKAQRVEIAIELAKLRAGEMKLICVDDFEMLDAEHFAAFQEQALASGLQLIVTRVTDGDFSIRTTG